MKLSSLSIILPCYNEEENLKKVVDQSLEVAHLVANSYKVIIVDDGSTDKTKQIALNLGKNNSNIEVISQPNKGYGGAITTGFNAVKTEWMFFTDSDLQFDLTELSNFIEYTKRYDFIFGYRIKRADKFTRVIIAKLLKIWNKIFLGFPLYIKDIDCAFKLMKTSSFKSIHPLVTTGAMISTEFILKIHKKGYKIKQIGVNHYPRIAGKSTGSNFGVIKKAVLETFKLRKDLKDSKISLESGIKKTYNWQS